MLRVCSQVVTTAAQFHCSQIHVQVLITMRFSLEYTIITLASFTTIVVQAALNGPCIVVNTPGVCVATADCTSGGGTYHSGYCPNDPEDVKCCTKTVCGQNGNCRWTSQCSGTIVSNLCPGPNGFKCCQNAPPIPTIPANNCKSHVVTSGYKILEQFPGYVHTVWCYANKPGDHGLGLALDFMIPNRAAIGRTMAEWTMNNHASLKVKYVIWGQKIWNVQVDVTPKPWSDWRAMEDRGDDTANHWLGSQPCLFLGCLSR
ncbi:hypothetical protein BDZ91DRAFT_715892 [Kalaharituber pfeilii]|nr:hypothetical protein BDZ91DRAFT_715892 [Kalaharituber pfeilii]